MTDRESELIERLMHGDMEAYDELMPNARPEDRAMFEDAIKELHRLQANPDTVERAWILWVLYLISNHCI